MAHIAARADVTVGDLDRGCAAPASLTRSDYALAAALALVLVFGGLVRMVPGVVGVFHDDAVYAISAKALAEGDGYRLVNLPDAPPQTKYPILYPAVLSVMWRAFSSLDARIVAMQALTLVLAAVALAAAYLYAVRFGVAARLAAVMGTLLAASAPNLLFYSVQPLSEMLFAALLVAALWMGERLLRDRKPHALVDFGAGVALGVPFLCRVVGIVVPAVTLPLLLLRGRRVGWVALGTLAAMAPWLVWLAYWRGANDTIVGYQTDYLGWWWDNAPLRSLGQNVLKALVAFSHIGFEGFADALYARLESARALFTAVGALAWLVVVARARNLVLLPAVFIGYFVVVCFWPWPPDRFLIPVLPLLAMLLFEQIRRVSARLLGLPAATALVMVACLLPVVANARLLARYHDLSRASHYPYFRPPDEPVAWTSYTDAFRWLYEHSVPEDVIAAGFDSMTALYTERRAIRPFVARPRVLYYRQPGLALGSVADLDEVLGAHRPRYLFVSPMPSFPEEEAFYELIAEMIRSNPARLVLAYRGSDPRFMIYEVAPAGR